MFRNIEEKINQINHRLSLLELRLKAHNPTQLVEQKQQEIAVLTQQLSLQMRRYMDEKTQTIHVLMQSLDYLSPLKIMDRGYSYVTKNGEVIKESEQVEKDEVIEIHLHKGKIEAKVTKKVEEI